MKVNDALARLRRIQFVYKRHNHTNAPSQTNKPKEPTEILDSVLEYLSELPSPFYEGTGFIHSGVELKYNNGLTNKETWDVLQKLKKDGFVDKIEEKGETYFITFEGKVLLQVEGGYHGRLKAKQAEETKQKKDSRVNNIISGIGGVLLGFLLSALPKCQDTEPVHVLLDSPKNQTYRDTVFLINPPISKDTSLIRIVKRVKRH